MISPAARPRQVHEPACNIQEEYRLAVGEAPAVLTVGRLPGGNVAEPRRVAGGLRAWPAGVEPVVEALQPVA